MSSDERRGALVDVTLRLLREHGRAITTRQIAEEAGIAEGTIFRAFESKDELVDLAIARAFEPGDLVARIEEIDPGLPLRERLVVLASVFQQRYRATFSLMEKVGLIRPPDHLHDSEAAVAWRARMLSLVTALVGDDADQLAVSTDHFVHVFRLLAFAGSHEQITDSRLLTPEQIVDTVLDGLRRTTRC